MRACRCGRYTDAPRSLVGISLSRRSPCAEDALEIGVHGAEDLCAHFLGFRRIVIQRHERVRTSEDAIIDIHWNRKLPGVDSPIGFDGKFEGHPVSIRKVLVTISKLLVEVDEPLCLLPADSVLFQRVA